MFIGYGIWFVHDGQYWQQYLQNGSEKETQHLKNWQNSEGIKLSLFAQSYENQKENVIKSDLVF